MSDNFPTPDTHVRKLGTQHPYSDVCRCMPYVRRAVFRTRPLQIIGGGAANHQSRLLPLRAPEQRIRRTDHVRQVSVSHVRVDLRSSRLAVSQQPLDVTLLGPALHEVRRERVP